MTTQRIYGFHRNNGMLYSRLARAPKGQKNRKLPPIGELLEHPGEIAMCQSGLHMTDTAIGAIARGEGKYLDYVILQGDIDLVQDSIGIKYVGRTREIYRRVNLTPIMRPFMKDVIEEILPIASTDKVVRQYVIRGSRKLKTAAIAQNQFELATRHHRKTEYGNSAAWRATYAIKLYFENKPLVTASRLLTSAVQCKAYAIASDMPNYDDSQFMELVRTLWMIYDQRLKVYLGDVL